MLSGQKKNLFAVAKTWYQQFTVHTLSLCQNNRAICGFHLGYLDSELVVDVMNSLLELYQQGKIKPRIDSTYHFEQVCVISHYIAFVYIKNVLAIYNDCIGSVTADHTTVLLNSQF